MRDDGAGGAVLIKHADGADRERLFHEAAILALARGEGVVEAVGCHEFGERCELQLRYLEAAALAEHPPLSVRDLMDVLVQVGTTLAGLHDRGIGHGALSSDHILLERPLRAVLCGFGRATGPADAHRHPPDDDLAALASLAEFEITRTDREHTSANEHRLCSEALLATRELAASAETGSLGTPTPSNDLSDNSRTATEPVADVRSGDPLRVWLARIERVRHTIRALSIKQHDGGDEPIGLDFGVRHPALTPLGEALGVDAVGAAARMPSQEPSVSIPQDPLGLRERLRADEPCVAPTATARSSVRHWGSRRVVLGAGVAAVAVGSAFVGWQLRGAGNAAAAPARIEASEGVAAEQAASQPPEPVALHEDGHNRGPASSARLIEASAAGGDPHGRGEQSRHAQAESSQSSDAADAASSSATLVYATPRPLCADPDANDCIEPHADESSAQRLLAALARSSSGQWRLGEAGDLASLSCDVVLVHYGELNVGSEQFGAQS